MQLKHLEKLDIFHLQLLLSLYKTPNTVHVAQQLNISQSSVSRGLTRLRYIFQDQLFIRGQHGLHPTHLAIELAKRLPGTLNQLLDAIQPNQSFNPQELSGPIKVAMHPVLLQLLAGNIYKAFNAQAPNASLHLEHWEKGTSNKLLENNVHIGLNYQIDLSSKAFYSKNIYQDTVCIMARKDHPLVGHHLSLSALKTYDFFSVVVPEFNDNLAMRRQIERNLKTTFKTPFNCPDLYTLMHLITESDALLAGLQLFQANHEAQLATLNIDIPLFDSIPIMVYGNQKLKNSPKFQWLEGLLVNALDDAIS